MKRKHYLLITLLIVLFLTVNIVLLERDRDVDRTVLISEPISPKEKTLKTTFGTDGVIEPSSVSHVYAENERGEIKSVLVEEGQHIEEGTPLVEYVNESSQAEVEALKHTNEELELKKEKLLEDRAVLEEEISETETLPDIEGQDEDDQHVHPSYDQTRPIQYEINNIEYSVKQIELEQANNQAKIDALTEASLETVVESEVAGIVTKVHGTSRADGEPILTIASNNPLWAVAYVDEQHIHQVEAGQSVMLYPEYLKSNKVLGTVIDVGTYPEDLDESDGQSQYSVTIEIDEGAVTGEDGSSDEPTVEDDSEQSAEESNEDLNVVPSGELKAEGEDPESAPIGEATTAETEAVPIRIGAHMNADITLKEMTGPTVLDKAVKHNKAIVLQKGMLKQQKVSIGLHADEQYVIAKGLKAKQLLLREADLTIHTGTSYITKADWNALAKKRIKQFSGKEFSLLYLHGFLQ